jgi:shikimate dehydrogenase
MKKYLVIGNPIKHSLSPKLHNYWIQENNIDAVYNKQKIHEDDLKKIISEIRDEKIHGMNVTTPFKKNIIAFVDKMTPIAEEAQSVNTVYKKNNKIIGDNTDIEGFEQSIYRLCA